MAKKDPPSLSELVESGVIKELNPELAAKAIEGYSDELAPAARVQNSFYRQQVCLECNSSSLNREYLGGPRARGTTWDEGVLPNAVLRCTDCGSLFNPNSGMIIERGCEIGLPLQADAPGLIRTS